MKRIWFPVVAMAGFIPAMAAYAGMPNIQVRLATEGPAIHAEMHNGTNQLTLALAEQPYGGTTLVAAYDNLGKGSAGAAADNLRRMLA